MLGSVIFVFLLTLIEVFGKAIVPLNCTTQFVGNCENKNELCEFIPLPHILCNEQKIKQQCPQTCNSCPEPLESGIMVHGDAGNANNINVDVKQYNL